MFNNNKNVRHLYSASSCNAPQKREQRDNVNFIITAGTELEILAIHNEAYTTLQLLFDIFLYILILGRNLDPFCLRRVISDEILTFANLSPGRELNPYLFLSANTAENSQSLNRNGHSAMPGSGR